MRERGKKGEKVRDSGKEMDEERSIGKDRKKISKQQRRERE